MIARLIMETGVAGTCRYAKSFDNLEAIQAELMRIHDGEGWVMLKTGEALRCSAIVYYRTEIL